MQSQRTKVYERTQWAIVQMGSMPPMFLSEMNEDGTNKFSQFAVITTEDFKLVENWIEELKRQGQDVEHISFTDCIEYSIN